MKKLLLSISLSVIVCNVFGTQFTTFQKVIKAHNTTTAYAVQVTKDGGYIVTGQTTSFSPSNTDMYLVKIDFKGDTVWTKTFGGSGTENGFAVDTTSDGGYIVAGATSSFGQGTSGDMYVVKTKANGDTLWTRAYGSYGSDAAVDIQQTSDGGYIIAGYFQNYSGRSDNDVYLIKITSTGDTTWTRTYGGTGQDYANSVRQTSDGGYIVCGRSTSFGNGLTHAYVIKTNSTGDTLWTKTYGGLFPDAGYVIRQNANGSFVMVGGTQSFGNQNGSDDIYLITMEEPTGDIIWSRTYGGATEDIAYGMEITNDGGYILVGYSNSFGTAGDIYAVKTDGFGDTLWTKTYGGAALDQAYAVKPTADGGYIIAGKGYSNYMYLVKTDDNGRSGCNEAGTATTFSSPTSTELHAACTLGHAGLPFHTLTVVGRVGNDSTLCVTVGIEEFSKNNNTLSVYPNPAGNELKIKSELRTQNAAYTITNVLGETVQSAVSNLQAAIDVAALTPGIYFIRVEGDKEVWTGRFVKE